MSKLNYCNNGNAVTDQVLMFQKTEKSDDFIPIMEYYNSYKDIWFAQLEDYIDRTSFDAEFDFRLFKAVRSFNGEAAQKNSKTKGLDYLGNFNRWFYKILMNWKSNVKTSSFRLKKRPGVDCPVCGRTVGRIDDEHLQHYKRVSDLPGFVTWKGIIYEVFTTPKVTAISWGKRNQSKIDALLLGNVKPYQNEREKVEWPWRLKDGKRGVLCPLTKKIVSKIDDEYIKYLPENLNRYATPMSWNDFTRNYPSSIIQSEIFSLDHSMSDKSSDSFSDVVASKKLGTLDMDSDSVIKGLTSPDFEHAFKAIDNCVKDTTDANILKLLAVGYDLDEICNVLKIKKNNVKTRIKKIKQDGAKLEHFLVEV